MGNDFLGAIRDSASHHPFVSPPKPLMPSFAESQKSDPTDIFAFARKLQTAIWVYDISRKRIIHANASACALWNAETEAELKQRDLSKGMTNTVAKRLEQYLSDFEAGHGSFQENWTLFPKGLPVTIDVIYSGFRLPDNRMAMLCESLGQKDQTNDTLRSLKALLHTDVTIGLFSFEGKLLYQNPAARDFTPNRDMTLADFYVSPEEYKACRKDWLNGKDTQSISKMHTSEGEIWFDLSVKVSLDAVTGEKALLATGVDVTNLKTMEAEVEWKQRQLEASFSTSHDAIIIFDAEGFMLEANDRAEEMFGFQREDVIGKDMADYIIPERHRSLHHDSLKYVASARGNAHETFRTEIEAMRINGEEFMSELSVSRSRGEDEDIFVAYIRDISKAKAAEQALIDAKLAAEAANLAKTTFLANMSHEIRTPMNGVLGVLDILRRTELTEEQRNYTDIIDRSGNTLLTILSDILDLSKIDSGKEMVHPEPCDLKKVVRDSVNLFSASANEKGLRLSWQYDPTLATKFIADPNRIQQILSNLIGNAIKFTPDGSIDIGVSGKLRNDKTDLEITVTDTGIGIEKSKVKSIFEAFTQAENSTTRKFGGTGLGLTISRRLAEAMKGSLTVESEPGVGTTFKLKLTLKEIRQNDKPVQDPQRKSRRVAKDESHKSGGRSLQSKLNFLIVEDDDVNQMVLKSYLTHPKIELTLAETGLEAVEAFRRQHFDLVFMDVSMPVMGGEKATQIIRNEELKAKRARTPIICVTAHAMKSDRGNFLRAGMDDYLSKPLRKEDLFKVMKKWLKARSHSPSAKSA